MHYKLSKTPEVQREYDDIIQEQLTSGIIEVPNPEVEMRNKDVHYLLHHAVIRQNQETTKLELFMMTLQNRWDKNAPSMIAYPLVQITSPNWLMCWLDFNGIELQFLQTLRRHS